MSESQNRPLRVFLCHSSNDKPTVRDLYNRLDAEGWIDVWLDESKLYPGQDWNFEIEKAVEEADVILVCLTKNSVSKEGYIQRELRKVLDLSDYKPEGMLFVIPVRLEECEPPRRLRLWQYADYFPKEDRDRAFQRLLVSLKIRAENLGLVTAHPAEEKDDKITERQDNGATLEKETRVHSSTGYQSPITIDQPFKELAQNEEEVETSRKDEVRGKKPNFLPYGIGVGILLMLMFGIFGINSWIQNAVGKETLKPISTQTPTRVIPTNTITVILQTPVPTLGIGSTMVSANDSMVMVYIPSGKFTMGNNAEETLATCQRITSECLLDWFKDEEPPHQVDLDAYWIDQTEVSNAMYAMCVQERKCAQPATNKSYSGETYYGNPDFDNFPVNNVSWTDADSYCSWAGRRLATEAEWEKSATWDENAKRKYAFPWGNVFDGSLLNYCDKNCPLEWSDKNTDDGFAETAPVGNYQGNASSYGVLDMAGNVWEWVNDRYNPDYYGNSPLSNPTGPKTGQDRVLRGGSWGGTIEDIFSTGRLYLDPVTTNHAIGFRCALSE